MKESEKNFAEKNAKKNAANQLMTQFVKDNAQEIAMALQDIIPFMAYECDLSGLKDALNIVNLTFASVALDVIQSAENDEDEQTITDANCLPVEAKEMQDALYTFTKFLRRLLRLDLIMRSNSKNPAFELTRDVYDKPTLI